jgi:acetyltransferase-like isoleucine patch superfamily enzyme
MGDDVFIDRGVSINNPRDVCLGHDVYLDENVIIRTTEGCFKAQDYVRVSANTYIQAGGGVTIMSKAAISSGCRIYSQTHKYWRNPGEILAQSSMVDNQEIEKKPVVIGSCALLGTNTTLLPGVRIGEFSSMGHIV